MIGTRARDRSGCSGHLWGMFWPLLLLSDDAPVEDPDTTANCCLPSLEKIELHYRICPKGVSATC